MFAPESRASAKSAVLRRKDMDANLRLRPDDEDRFGTGSRELQHGFVLVGLPDRPDGPWRAQQRGRGVWHDAGGSKLLWLGCRDLGGVDGDGIGRVVGPRPEHLQPRDVAKIGNGASRFETCREFRKAVAIFERSRASPVLQSGYMHAPFP